MRTAAGRDSHAHSAISAVPLRYRAPPYPSTRAVQAYLTEHPATLKAPPTEPSRPSMWRHETLEVPLHFERCLLGGGTASCSIDLCAPPTHPSLIACDPPDPSQ